MPRLPLSAALFLGLLTGDVAVAQLVFEPPLRSDAGTGPARLVTGDVDEDGVPDVLVSYPKAAHLVPVLCHGNGDGSFGPPQPVAGLAAGATVMLLAHFNGDSHLDLVATDTAETAMRLGDGHGAFGLPATVDALPANAVDTGDFDGDGRLDVVVRNDSIVATIDVVLGHGNGSFDAPFTAVSSPNASVATAPLHVGDVNADGRDDIVVRSNSPSNGFYTFYGQGTAGWQSVLNVSGFWGGAPAFVMADINEDGFADAITRGYTALGKPSGGFSTGQDIHLIFTNVLTAGDFDGDGHVDVAADRTLQQEVVLVRGLGDGTFQKPELVMSHVGTVTDLEAVDADADGRADVLASAAPPAGYAGSLAMLRNHTYGAGSPFLDLGFVFAPKIDPGAPILLADGTLIAGEPFSFRLANGTPSGFAGLYAGPSQVNAPYKGGTLVPLTTVVVGPLALDATGGITLSGTFPSGSSGITIYLQFWIAQGGTPQGFVSSSGVRAQVP